MRAANFVRLQCTRPASKHYGPEQSARPLQQTTNNGDRSGVGDGQEKRWSCFRSQPVTVSQPFPSTDRELRRSSYLYLCFFSVVLRQHKSSRDFVVLILYINLTAHYKRHFRFIQKFQACVFPTSFIRWKLIPKLLFFFNCLYRANEICIYFFKFGSTFGSINIEKWVPKRWTNGSKIYFS